MDALQITRTVAEVLGGITLLFLLVKVNHLIKQVDHLVTFKTKTDMAKLSDFQAVGAEIDQATEKVTTFVQSTGMSAAEQDEALKTITDAVGKLNAAIPTPPPPPGQ